MRAFKFNAASRHKHVPLEPIRCMPLPHLHAPPTLSSSALSDPTPSRLAPSPPPPPVQYNTFSFDGTKVRPNGGWGVWRGSRIGGGTKVRPKGGSGEGLG